MKKIILAMVCILFVLSCTNSHSEQPKQPSQQPSNVNLAELDNKMKASIEGTMRARGLNVTVDVERLGELDGSSGFYFYKVTVNDMERGLSQEQFLFFNGEYLATDFINAATTASKAKEFLFDYVSYDIDVSKLSLVQGNPDAKNIIVKVTDFECSFCRRAYEYLEQQIKGRNDVAMYIAHFPLRMHENAEISARIFEAGLIMGKNFMDELFTSDMVLDYTPYRLADYFAEESGDADKVMDLLYDDEGSLKILNGLKWQSSLN